MGTTKTKSMIESKVISPQGKNVKLRQAWSSRSTRTELKFRASNLGFRVLDFGDFGFSGSGFQV